MYTSALHFTVIVNISMTVWNAQYVHIKKIFHLLQSEKTLLVLCILKPDIATFVQNYAVLASAYIVIC